MSKKVFQQYCESALQILNSQYEATKLLQHNATAGTVREQIIKDFLAEHIPELITVMSGQIFDAEDNFSKQQDIVLVLKSMPRLPFSSGNDLIFQEGVVATLEIKTSLNSAVLKTIGENIGSVRKLKSAIGATGQMGITHNWPVHKILTSIVTYSGTSFDAISPQLQTLSHDEKPDLILDLSKGLLVKNDGLLIPQQNNSDYILFNNAAEGFKMFLTFLTEITGTISGRGVLWRAYL